MEFCDSEQRYERTWLSNSRESETIPSRRQSSLLVWIRGLSFVYNCRILFVFRILPARFVQAQVGDMFVVRNSGNMVPHADNYGVSGYEVLILVVD